MWTVTVQTSPPRVDRAGKVTVLICFGALKHLPNHRLRSMEPRRSLGWASPVPRMAMANRSEPRRRSLHIKICPRSSNNHSTRPSTSISHPHSAQAALLQAYHSVHSLRRQIRSGLTNNNVSSRDTPHVRPAAAVPGLTRRAT
jgi:hypothetical protein